MKFIGRYLSPLLTVIVLIICSCGGEATKGPVRINSYIDMEDAFEGLEKETVDKLGEIKERRKSDKKKIDSGLSSVIRTTRHFTVSEYLEQYPDTAKNIWRDYRVGPFDVINITVYEEPDLSRSDIRVSGTGDISFPLIGKLEINDLTTFDIEKLISAKFAEQEYILNANVSVSIKEFNSRKFLILGAVRNPGSYSLSVEERVIDAISKSGGIISELAGKKGMLIRSYKNENGNEEKIVIDINIKRLLHGDDQSANIYLADSDIFYIPSADKFYIMGEIQLPGSYSIDKDLTLVEAISMAGGFTEIAARNRSRIIRVEGGMEKIIEVNVDRIMKSGRKTEDVFVLPDDIIVIPESFF